jgi:hypothetical protein
VLEQGNIETKAENAKRDGTTAEGSDENFLHITWASPPTTTTGQNPGTTSPDAPHKSQYALSWLQKQAGGEHKRTGQWVTASAEDAEHAADSR